MKILAPLVFAFFASSALSASFDCTKASNFVEKAVCNDDTLSKLDEALARNYRSMLNADVGASKQELRAEQLRWLASRNACRTEACILDAYRKRVDETCEYGVVSGVHPVCTMAEDVLQQRPAASQTKSAGGSTAAVVRPEAHAKDEDKQLIAKHAKSIATLGFSQAILKAPIYVSGSKPVASFERWLAHLFESGNWSRVSQIEYEGAFGVSLKRQGARSVGVLFKNDGGDLFPVYYIRDDKVYEPANEVENALMFRFLTQGV